MVQERTLLLFSFLTEDSELPDHREREDAATGSFSFDLNWILMKIGCVAAALWVQKLGFLFWFVFLFAGPLQFKGRTNQATYFKVQTEQDKFQ